MYNVRVIKNDKCASQENTHETSLALFYSSAVSRETIAGMLGLPVPAKIGKIGGPGKEFLVNGVNYATTKGGDAEPGAWRLEVSPRSKSAAADFLNVMLLYPRKPVSRLPVDAVKGDVVSGVQVAGWTVVAPSDDKSRTRLSYECPK